MAMEEKYPQLVDRLQSTFIDLLLLVVLTFGFSFILDKTGNPPDWVKKILFFGLWVVYDPLCTSLGYTLGNYIKGIRVRKASDTSKRINLFQALVRYVFKMMLGWLSFLTINTNPRKQAIHDFIVGSVVIKL